MPHEFAIFVRSAARLSRAQSAATNAELPYKVLDEKIEPVGSNASISTMHLAKGLEFRAVIVMACDDEVIPLQERIESIGDDADLQEVYDTERQFYMSLAHVHATFCCLLRSSRRRNYWKISATDKRCTIVFSLEED